MKISGGSESGLPGGVCGFPQIIMVLAHKKRSGDPDCWSPDRRKRKAWGKGSENGLKLQAAITSASFSLIRASPAMASTTSSEMSLTWSFSSKSRILTASSIICRQ